MGSTIGSGTPKRRHIRGPGLGNRPCHPPRASATYDSSTNRLTDIGGQTPNYDAAGNLLSDGTGTGTYTYTWDAEQRLKTSPGGAVSYTYDGSGQRVKKSNGTLYWYGAGGAILAETNLSGGILNEYIYFGGARIARRDGSGNVYYYFADHLGSSRVMTNSTGTVCYEADFYPFGGERNITSSCAQTFKFAGMEYDSETGLNHTLFRQQSASVGRWLSPDRLSGSILNPQSLNRYTYALNNPCNLVDPLGLETCNLNVPLINEAGFTGEQVMAVMSQINKLLGMTKWNGNTVQLNFNSGGEADTSLSLFEHQSLLSWAYTRGPAIGLENKWLGITPRVYTENLSDIDSSAAQGRITFAQMAGAAGLHELAHKWFGGALTYDSANLNTLMFENLPKTGLITQQAALSNPNSPIWRLSTGQTRDLFKQCQDKHAASPSGGGNGPLPGERAGAGPDNPPYGVDGSAGGRPANIGICIETSTGRFCW